MPQVLEELPLGENGQRVLGIRGTDLCDMLGLSPAALSGLKQKGLARHLGKDSYDLHATVNAYVAHLRETASGRGGEDHVTRLTAQRARLAREQADAQAIKNAKARSELVRAADVEGAWADILRKVRSRVLSIPARVREATPELDRQAVAKIDAACRAALTDLAEGATDAD